MWWLFFQLLVAQVTGCKTMCAILIPTPDYVLLGTYSHCPSVTMQLLNRARYIHGPQGAPRYIEYTQCRVCPGEVLRFELDRGVPLEPQNPNPSLRVILAEKGTHFKDFSWKNRPIFQKFRDFRGFRHAKTRKFGLSQKSWPMFKDFLVKNGTHV